MKKIISLFLSLFMVLSLVACAGGSAATQQAQESETQAEATSSGKAHIGIVTGSVSQSEDDRRGAE